MTQTTFFLLLLFPSLFFVSYASADQSPGRKLFVFGDSYADTGNWNQTYSSSWKPPYGITFPGKPAGRFSDGQILTDYIASYLQMETPTPYTQRHFVGVSKEKLKFGMNFAYGGTGVFDTDVKQPNLTAQIDFFQNLITEGNLYTKTDLQSSIALVALGGNDYANFLKSGPPQLTLGQFTRTVVHQLLIDLKRIHKLGVSKIAITTMEPLGCLPAITFLSGYKNCSQSINDDSKNHNQLLQRSLDKINSKSQKPVFITIDLYGAFLSALQKLQIQPGAINPLVPCCQGVTGDYGCGSVEGGEAKYTVCNERQQAFFWDNVHPAQNGWYQVYLAIQPDLRKL